MAVKSGQGSSSRLQRNGKPIALFPSQSSSTLPSGFIVMDIDDSGWRGGSTFWRLSLTNAYNRNNSQWLSYPIF